ncbi:unnamed protein product [Eruca vesicaria subsp. sativa]|uniref:Uncharacterized protein n=1 Tax=Eruca vesicaria subsp. sativa TaxID=29727 RepID=A0ABC8LDN3_ERUVS|nr:unnamed protein product [Eruca vesicaria subsp. sativa]
MSLLSIIAAYTEDPHTLRMVKAIANLCGNERNHGAGSVKTKASHGATREVPKTNGGLDVVEMVEGTAASTPTLPAHMELMLR